MIYRTLGRTGLKVSQLGFGAMRLPMKGEGDAATVDRDLAVPMIRRAFEAGLNYIDTAVGYCNKDSQRAVGDALVGWRDKVVVSTKNPEYGPDEKVWWKNLTDSLERLKVQYIDVYNLHGVSWKEYTEQVEPRVGKWLLKARDQGLVKHVACSFHDNNDALRKIVDTGFFESVTLQYNMLDRQLEDGIAHAHASGMGVVAMGPVAGGRLGVDTKVMASLLPGVRRVPELALRFVLANPNVTVALSGMSTIQHVEENCAIAADAMSLTQSDKKAIDAHLDRMKELARLYCTGCDYCKPCPKEVNISGVFDLFNKGRVYGLWEHARNAYARLLKIAPKRGRGADACEDCGACEKKCPQKISIRRQLKEAHLKLMEVK